MIAFLEGRIEVVTTDSVILNVQGVGYRVEISTLTSEQLPLAGEEVRLRIHHHITDSDQRLFGFFSNREQVLFEKLITVKGVGPRLGLTILSGIDAPSLAEAIVQKDQMALSRIPGIGKKTAERIILELKDKILERSPEPGETGKETVNQREEAISALEALGFRKREAETAVMAIVKENRDAKVSDIVRTALSRQGRS